MDILVRSWQDLGTILTEILLRSGHDIHFAMVRFYQGRCVSKKNLTKKSKGGKTNLIRKLKMARKNLFEKLVFEKKSSVRKSKN